MPRDNALRSGGLIGRLRVRAIDATIGIGDEDSSFGVHVDAIKVEKVTAA